jgi:hypothetical protein
MPLTASIIFTNNDLRPFYADRLAALKPVRLKPSTTFRRGEILGELVGNNAVQTLTPGGTVSGGSYTLTFNAITTGAIAYNATAAQTQTALDAAFGVGNIVAAGGPVNAANVTLTFTGIYGNQAPALVTVNSSLTGTAPTLTPTTTTAGSAGTPGVYAPSLAANTDGSQSPRCILPYAAATDANGLISFSTVAQGGEFTQTYQTASAYFTGAFSIADLPGLTAGIIASWNGGCIIIEGTIAGGGVVQIN